MAWPAKTIRISFILLFILVPLIFLPATSELFEFNKMIVTYIATILIGTLWVADMILSGKIIFRRTALDIPLVLFLISQIISALLSIDPRTSWMGYYSRFNGGIVSLFCYSLLYWVYTAYSHPGFTLSILKWTAGSGLAVAIYGILQHFGIDDHLWVQDVKTRVFSTLGQPNWMASYVAALMFLPLTFAVTRSDKSVKINWWWTLCTVLMFLAFLYTRSRSGLLAFAVGSAVYLGYIFFKLDRKTLKYLLPLFAAGALATVIIKTPIRDLLIRPTQPEVVQGPALETGGTESGAIRAIVWKGALNVWRSTAKTFWFGSGTETFAMAYYQHRPIEHNNTSEWELLYNKAHNEFLNFLATTGLVGLVLYLVLLGTSLVMISKSFRTSSHPFFTVALCAGWVTLPVANFWGFSVVITQLFLFLFPAMAFSFTQKEHPSPIHHLSGFRNLLLLILFAGSGWLLYSTIRYWVADMHYASGQKNLRSFTATQDPAYIITSYEEFASAYELNSSDAPIPSELSVIAAYMSLLFSENNATASAQFAQTALKASERAIELSPYHPNYLKSRSRAAIILSTIDPKYLEVADQAMEQAGRISPTDPRIPNSRGVIAKYRGQNELARTYFEAALKLKPDFGDPRVQLQEIASSAATPTP